MKKNSYLFRLVRNRKILREKEKKQREPIVRPIFDRREIVSAISIWTFNYRKSARNEVMAVGGGKNLGNANAGRTENETRPSFPGFKHSRIYYRRVFSCAWPPTSTMTGYEFPFPFPRSRKESDHPFLIGSTRISACVDDIVECDVTRARIW